MHETQREGDSSTLTAPAEVMPVLNFAAGEWVQVRPRSEILATLDEKGCLDVSPQNVRHDQGVQEQVDVERRAPGRSQV